MPLSILSRRQSYLNWPALAPPAGAESDFNAPNKLQRWSYAITIICFSFSTASVLMRTYTRVRIIRRVTFIDYAILLSWALFTADFALSIVSINKGVWGRHQWDISVGDISSMIYSQYATADVYIFCILFLKVSILLQYVQTFVPAGQRSPLFWASYAFIAINVLYYVIGAFIEAFPCKPVEKVWKPWIDGHCFNPLAGNVTTTCINAASDIAILILPQISIFKLHLSRAKKMQISAIFLIGLVACIVSIIRIPYAVFAFRRKDFAYWVWWFDMWTYPEICAGFLVACLPVSPIFVKSLGEKWSSLKIGSSVRSLLPSNRRNGSQTAGDSMADYKMNSKSNKLGHRKTGNHGTCQNPFDEEWPHEVLSVPSSSKSSKDEMPAYTWHTDSYVSHKMEMKDMV